jgi:uncharacterized membrane protein YecN with MAPEG domain
MKPGIGTICFGAAVAFLALSWSDGHYWDEYFYLYSVAAHSPTELVRYELQSGIFPPGFFSEKIAHVVVLDLLTSLLGTGPWVVYALQALYAVLLLAFFGAAYGLLRRLLGERVARDSALVLAFSPLALYLSFKLMSEVPGLLFATLAGWAFVAGLETGSRRRTVVRLALAALALAVALLFRITMVVSFAGLGLALLVAGDERFERGQVLRRLLAVGIPATVLYAGGLALADGGVLRIGAHIASVVSTHPPLQRVYALGLFIQTLVLVLPFAWRRRQEPAPRLGFLWLAASALPFLAGHEPRYYAPALVPLAVVVGAGLRGASDFLLGSRLRYGWVGLLAALTLVNRGLLVPIMPYEVDQARLLGLFQGLQARDPQATYLIPWTTDFSLLRFAFPEARIELCLSDTPESRHYHPGHEGPISRPDQWWAGTGRYVGSYPELERQPRPWYLVGWTYNPAAVRLSHLLGRASLGLLRAGPVLHNHLAGTWVWHDPSVRLTPRGGADRYRVYRVDPTARTALVH